MKIKDRIVAAIAVATAGTIACAAPANDTSCAAIDISSINATPTLLTVSDANLATEDADVSCNQTSGTQTAKYGVWYVYTATGSANIRVMETSTEDVSLSVWQGASCSTLTQVAGACSDEPEDVVFTAAAGQTYYILVNMWSNTRVPAATGYALSFTAFATPANDVCTGATLVNSFPFTNTVDQRVFTNDADVSCNSGTTGTVMGSWYRYDATATGQIVFSEIGLADTVVQLYTGNCGALVASTCSDTPESVTINTVAGTSYWVLVSRYTSAPASPTFFRTAPYTNSTDPFIITATQVFPPDNDTCATAEAISLPYTGSVEVRAAGHDPDVSCNDAANTQLRRAVWYRFTPTSNGSLFMNEAGATDVVFAVYSGFCGSLVDVTCTDGEPSLVPVTSGTTYYIAVGMKSATVEPTVPLTPSFEFVVPPANDNCVTAAPLVLPSGAITSDARAALNDPDVACNLSSSSSAVAGSWFRINSGIDAGEINISEGSLNDVVLVLYQGQCGTLTTLACTDTPESLTRALAPNTDYFLMVAQWSAAIPTAPYAISYAFNAITGACCNAGSCTLLSASDCAAASGSWQGANVSCEGVLNSTAYASTDAFPAAIPDNAPAGISRSVTISGTGATIDADGIAVTMNLNHTWCADAVVTISNGTVTADLVRRIGLGVGGSTVGDSANFAGAYTFLDQSTSSIWAAAAVNTSTDLILPPGQYFASTTDGVQLDLGAAFNGQPLDGTWTLAISDNAPSDSGTLTGFSVQLAKFNNGPCPTGQTPCQVADFNNDNSVTADDIFAFLDGWFTQNGQTGAGLTADVNGDNSVTADDIFAYLDTWFAQNGQTCP